MHHTVFRVVALILPPSGSRFVFCSDTDAKNGVGGSGSDDQSKTAQLKSKQQITASRQKFDAAKDKAEQLVSDVRVERDKIEAERRIVAAEQREVPPICLPNDLPASIQ
jgi:hypothetical protein